MDEFLLEDEIAQVALGAALGRAMAFRGSIWLEGELGAGKTTLARGVMRALGVTGAVKSPTYTLLEPYELERGRVHHFDLYRLADPEELEFLGARELLETPALNLIEWPSRGRGWLPEPDLKIRLGLADRGRRAVVESFSEHGAQALSRLSPLFEQALGSL